MFTFALMALIWFEKVDRDLGVYWTILTMIFDVIIVATLTTL
jgi:hypothetical protein